MKRIITIILAITMLCSYGVRLYFVNKDATAYNIQYANINENIDLSEKYYFTENSVDMNGYTVKVLNSFTKTLEEMYTEYNYSLKAYDKYVDFYYIVEVSFENKNSENPNDYSGINLQEFSLQGLDYLSLIENDAYVSLNPDFTDLTFKLRVDGEPFTRLLPFPIISSNFKNTNSVIENPPFLQVSTFPQMVLIETK